MRVINRKTKALLLAVAVGLLVHGPDLVQPAVANAQGADTVECNEGAVVVPKSWGVFRDSQQAQRSTTLYFEEPSTGVIRRVYHGAASGSCSVDLIITRK